MVEERKNRLSKPPAIRDEGTTRFFDGAAEGKLMLQYCSTCDNYSLSGGRYCPHCLAKVEWKATSGRGVVHIWAVNHQVHNPAFAAEVPYLFAAVDLDEGPQIVTRLMDIEQADLRIGLPVRVRFISHESGEAIPAFGPA